MKNFFSTFFASKPAAANSTLSGSRDSRDSRLSLRDTSENGLRQQLVLVMMRDLLRKSGIAPTWVDCHVQVANSRTRGQGVYVRLVLKHWDERLMKYSFAFQKALLTNIVQFEPKAAGWLHGITWQLEVASNCPYPELPDRNFWVYAPPQQAGQPATSAAVAAPTSVAAAVALAAPTVQQTSPFAINKSAIDKFAIDKTAPKPTPQNDAKEDLERLFAVRDHELARKFDKVSLSAGFESTEPSPLA